jgi:hypothetical protein
MQLNDVIKSLRCQCDALDDTKGRMEIENGHQEQH